MHVSSNPNRPFWVFWELHVAILGGYPNGRAL